MQAPTLTWAITYRAGVPQIVLPVWWDTYDFAVRTEWLGLGIYGNKRAAPRVESGEFGQALLAVVADYRAIGPLRQRAQRIGQRCRAGNGRATACARIMELVAAL
jgi:UDP:flavonoid glycosyltransferase YjiC (YdhE family)